ncbi:MAG: serine hydrolase [Patescibacteria group bacterium]|nr:serine hydrolase [Patescibacteria group bacterium]MDD4304557.1 serine hydrolase [Patescibacteria group bacterium]MDD4695744.1 serine hydrolase [Patescibacteria group bacterium]
MKKNILLFLVFVSFVFPNVSFAIEKDINYVDFTKWYEEKFKVSVPFKAVAILDYNTSEPLYYFQERKQMPSASLIKLVTAGTFLQFPIDWNKNVSFSYNDNEGDLRKYVGPKDSFVLLRIDDKDSISVKNMFASMLIISANNSANAISYIPGVSKETFIDAMRGVAKTWKMEDTKIDDPSGLSLGDITTARDMAFATCYAFKNPKISEFSSKPEFNFLTNLGQEKKLKHTVYDLRNNSDNYFGAKTGFLYETRFHLVAGFITPKNQKICVSILSTNTRKESEDILNILGDWVDDMYKL